METHVEQTLLNKGDAKQVSRGEVRAMHREVMNGVGQNEVGVR